MVGGDVGYGMRLEGVRSIVPPTVLHVRCPSLSSPDDQAQGDADEQRQVRADQHDPEENGHRSPLYPIQDGAGAPENNPYVCDPLDRHRVGSIR